MKNYQNKKGFTLIELLVVVLIIGILSAIALPQYQTAVLKARLQTLVPLLRTVADANERYRLANDQYTTSFGNLDISLPEGGTKTTAGNGIEMVQYNDWRIQLESTQAGGTIYMGETAVLQYQVKYSEGAKARQHTCVAFGSGGDIAHRVCKSYGGTVSHENSTYTSYQVTYKKTPLF